MSAHLNAASLLERSATEVLQAYDEGEDTLEELAEQFRVSLGWAKKIYARHSEMDSQASAGGAAG